MLLIFLTKLLLVKANERQTNPDCSDKLGKIQLTGGRDAVLEFVTIVFASAEKY